MIIYWILFIGILIPSTIGDELDIDESVLTAEEEEVGMEIYINKIILCE